MANPEAAAVLISTLNRVIRYAVGLGVTASVLQTSLYTGERRSGPDRARVMVPQKDCCPSAVDGGERAVIFDRFRGVLPQPVGEGMTAR